MAIGLGARKSNMDSKYYVGTQPDNYVTSGVAAGPVAVSSSFFGSGGGGTGLDPVSMWVWGITAGALAVVLGIHFTFGGFRL
jgi:hypothetical protein